MANNNHGTAPLTSFASASGETKFIECTSCTDVEPNGTYGMKVWIYNDSNGAFTNWANTISDSSPLVEQMFKKRYDTYTLKIECDLSTITYHSNTYDSDA